MGYLQVYLKLGVIGTLFLLNFLIACYRSIFKQFELFPIVASFGLGLWTVLLFYNITEAAFMGGLLWYYYGTCCS
jgi:hypothetical protein